MKSTQTGNLSSPRMLKCTLLASLAALTTGASALATSVTIDNFSFETPTIGSDNSFVTASSSPFNGWGYNKTTGSGFQDFGIENPGAVEYTNAEGAGTPLGAEGTNVAFLNQSIAGGIVNIFQDIGAIQANTTYTLTVAIGQRFDRVNGPATIALFNTASGSGTAGNPFTDISSTLLNSTMGVSSVAGSFQDFTVTFTTGGDVSGDLTIGLQYENGASPNDFIQASVDNVRLDATAVPEPGTVAMLLGGAGFLLVWRRSRS
jgi:hypothetical protein